MRVMTSQLRHLAYWHYGKHCHVTGHYFGLLLEIFISVYMCVCVHVYVCSMYILY